MRMSFDLWYSSRMDKKHSVTSQTLIFKDERARGPDNFLIRGNLFLSFISVFLSQPARKFLRLFDPPPNAFSTPHFAYLFPLSIRSSETPHPFSILYFMSIDYAPIMSCLLFFSRTWTPTTVQPDHF